MVDFSKRIGEVRDSRPLLVNDLSKLHQAENMDVSIFDTNMPDANQSAELLAMRLDSVNDENGVVLNTWNSFKEAVNLGVSSEDCEEAIQQYKNGNLSYEEALAKIEEYNTKQDGSLNLFSNIATGVAAIVAGTAAAGAILASCGTAAPLVLAAIGAGTGAVTKAGFKTADRATNEVDGDALNAKQIAKDALSGAVTGGIAVATAGTAGTPFNEGFKVAGKKVVEAGTKACIAKCTTTGIVTGAISGGSNNLIECAFEDDKDFNIKDFAIDTASSALVGGTVGALMGGFNGTLRSNGLLSSGGNVITANATEDVVANSVCNAEYKIVNNAVRSIAA